MRRQVNVAATRVARDTVAILMRGLVITVVGLAVGCLPWDPRDRDGGTDGGSADGGSADGNFVGDYVSTGGCAPASARCHPFCVPGAGIGSVSAGATCCLDDECATGVCFGAVGNRRCSAPGTTAAAGAPCGDETDCGSAGAACDPRTQRCSSLVTANIGPPESCQIGPSATSCSFDGLNGPFCALPGAFSASSGGNPCCYDRTDAGVWASCLETRSCYCLDGGSCGSYAGARCPF